MSNRKRGQYFKYLRNVSQQTIPRQTLANRSNLSRQQVMLNHFMHELFLFNLTKIQFFFEQPSLFDLISSLRGVNYNSGLSTVNASDVTIHDEQKISFCEEDNEMAIDEQDYEINLNVLGFNVY